MSVGHWTHQFHSNMNSWFASKWRWQLRPLINPRRSVRSRHRIYHRKPTLHYSSSSPSLSYSPVRRQLQLSPTVEASTSWNWKYLPKLNELNKYLDPFGVLGIPPRTLRGTVLYIPASCTSHRTNLFTGFRHYFLFASLIRLVSSQVQYGAIQYSTSTSPAGLLVPAQNSKFVPDLFSYFLRTNLRRSGGA